MDALAVLSSQERFYEQSREEFEEIVKRLDSDEVRSMTHSDLERELEKKGRELMRKLLQEHLESRGPGECAQPVRGSDGVERVRVRPHERKLETIFGTVSVERSGYGHKGNRSLHPLDAELNLPDKKYSLELCRRVAEEAAKSSFDVTFESINKYTGAHVPKRQIEAIVMRSAQDFDAFYEKRQEDASADKGIGSIMVMSVDGKGVVMRMQDLREQTRKTAMKRKHKMSARLSKGEKKNAKRMATVATVYTIAPFIRKPEDLVPQNNIIRVEQRRPRPEQKRVWASLEKLPEEVIEKAFEEADCRDPGHKKNWVALVDGNKHQIRILRRMAKDKGHVLTIIVDIIHVIEYLWDAGRAFYPKASQGLESWVRVRLLEILRGKAGYVAGGMRRSATRRSMGSADRKPVDACANYLVTYAPYLKYNQYLAQGFPIATGVIEGACRHLVKDRMEVTGARWSLTGAEAVLRLRALRSSHDFDEYWAFHEAQEYERNHRSFYANGIVPPTIQSQSTRKQKNTLLKAVK
jgi:exonuclease VII small subunit